jgi:hypothetical protein
MIVTLFLGPTISRAEALTIVPQAVCRPPAAQGDLLFAAEYDKADVIGLIDGTFHQNLSVWHNEICYLLSQGLTIYGSSSIGALRAVETEPFGMCGVGRVYEWYRDGIISGDDEVALIHGDESSNFRSLSVPMVNLRASMNHAVRSGMIDRETAARVVHSAKSVHYQERNVQCILERCKEDQFSQSEFASIRLALTDGYIDQKKEDACELLKVIARVAGGSLERPAPTQFVFARSSVFETLYNLDREVEVNGHKVSQQQIAENTALYCPEFWRLRRSALDRAIVAFFAGYIGIRVSEQDVHMERTLFCQENRLYTQEDFDMWLSDNAISEKDFAAYLAEEASCRRMRRWALTARSFDRGCKALLDELRVTGLFNRWAKEAADAEKLFATYRDQPEYLDVRFEHPAVLAQRHADRGYTRIRGDAGLWAEEAGFDGAAGLAEAVKRATIVNHVRDRIARQVAALQGLLAGLVGEAVDLETSSK